MTLKPGRLLFASRPSLAALALMAGLIGACVLGGCGGQSPGGVPETISSDTSPPELPGGRLIRVLLQEGLSEAHLILQGPFEVIDLDTGQSLHQATGAPHLTAVFTPEGLRLPELDCGSTGSGVELSPRASQTFHVRFDDGWREYHGSIRLVRADDGSGAVVNLIDIEDYLVAVVSAELPASFAVEAFRAQAIAARTYAWYQRQTVGRKRGWDVWATEKSQVYPGLARQRLVPRAAEAVRDTCGIVCTWSSPQGERIFCTYYSSRCGGTTVGISHVRNEPSIPPLAGGAACAYCRSQSDKHWPHSVRLSKAELTERLVARYPRLAKVAPITRVEIIQSTTDGRALRLELAHAAGESMELEAENFRLTVDPTGRTVQSTYFDVVDEGSAIVLVGGKGLGHGLGLCQYGADAMARAGADAAAILAHYYGGSHLTRAY